VLHDASRIPADQLANVQNSFQERKFNTTWQDALANGQLIEEDYTFLIQCRDPEWIKGNQSRWQPACHSFYFFDLDQQHLIPFYVHVNAVNGGVTYNDWFSKDRYGPWGWRYALCCVQSSTWGYHEVGAHLTMCHMVEEVFAVATKRCLQDHPILALLDSHFVRTFALNELARTVLVPKQLYFLSGTSENGVHMAIHHFFDLESKKKSFASNLLPNEFAERGFTRQSVKSYPYYYGHDSLAIWDNIYKFCGDFVDLYYKTDEAVTADQAVLAWAKEIRDKGKYECFPDFTICGNQRAVLTGALTYIIHIASVQHSAINYAQFYYMSYSGFFPGFMSGSFPDSKTSWTEERVCTSLPGVEACLMTVAIMYILSQPVEYFMPAGPPPMLPAMAEIKRLLPETGPAWLAFSNAMKHIQADILTRNNGLSARGLIPYDILAPVDKAANSIQI